MNPSRSPTAALPPSPPPDIRLTKWMIIIVMAFCWCMCIVAVCVFRMSEDRVKLGLPRGAEELIKTFVS